tara:strand:+ start:1257 stop:1460 length:204 start_codon:yes stop_codon:yes gene_type:complete
MYRNRQINQLFILKNLQTLKISKYRVETTKKVKNHEKKIKWFLIWPIIDLHEWYEEYKKDKNGDIKT